MVASSAIFFLLDTIYYVGVRLSPQGTAGQLVLHHPISNGALEQCFYTILLK
jgi:hypothetical protein